MSDMHQIVDHANGGTPSSTVQSDALHWFDFICPFCYVSQDKGSLLVKSGFDVVDLPFQAHPDIPAEGVLIGPRRGPMYTELERQAKSAGLALNWPDRLPNSRTALAASAWLRRSSPNSVRQFNAALFNAHFVDGEDLGDAAVVIRHAVDLGVEVTELKNALADGSALVEVANSEALARSYGVRGTPAWILNGTLVEGVLPESYFRRLADKARR